MMTLRFDFLSAKQRLWNPMYQPKIIGEILICGESEESLDKAAQDIKRDVYGIYKEP